MSSLSGVGEAEDGAELHPQDEVEDEEGLPAQCAGNIKLLKPQRLIYLQTAVTAASSVALSSLLTVRPCGKSKRSAF